jgi:hypothetical protein
MSEEKAKHTPESWEVCSANKTEVNTPSGIAIAECHMSQTIPHEEKVANAHLIAKAPKMLEALKEAKQYLDDRNLGDRAEELRKSLRLTIERAEGGK